MQSFAVELDNEYEPTESGVRSASPVMAVAIDANQVAESVELDPFEVNTERYWELLDAQVNVDDQLRAMLKASYGASSMPGGRP